MMRMPRIRSERSNALLFSLFWIASVVCFALGLAFPLLSTKKHIMGITLSFSDIRLFDSVRMFVEEGEYLLGFVILFFTVIFPGFKYLELLNRKTGMVKVGRRLTGILMQLDKWSMLDVFIVALLILNFRLDSRIVVMELKIGTHFLVVSIVLRMAATWFLAARHHMPSQSSVS